jgi:putative addiction module component (TIGR02574 family)
MSDRARKLLEDALALPVPDRADLAAELLASLEAEDEGDVEAAWAAEIEQRARRAHADPEGGLPWESVRDELQATVRRG